MKLALRLVLLANLALLGCGARPEVPTLDETAFDLEIPFAEAAEKEQLASDLEATEAYLALLDRAIALPEASHALEAVLASLDALVSRTAPSLDALGEAHALAFRAPSAMELVRARLLRAWEAAHRSGPFVRPAIARAGHALALYEGDAEAAAMWRGRTGCVREAAVVGPLATAPLSKLDRASVVETSPEFLASYPGLPPFQSEIAPVLVEADGCALPVDATSALDGLRVLAVDILLPRPMRIGVGLRSASAAAVVVGGEVAVSRPFSRGGSPILALGTADLPEGRARVVVRLAQRGEGGDIELYLHDDEGKALARMSPRPSDLAPTRAQGASDLRFEALRGSPRERALVAAAHLALDDGRPAAYLLESAEPRDTPLLALLYARALDEAAHLPVHLRAERSRQAFEAVLSRWPGAWEAKLGLLTVEARRRSLVDGRFSILRGLREAREVSASPLLPALEAVLSSMASLPDRANEALARLKAMPVGRPLEARIEARLTDAVGAEAEALACTTPGLDRDSLACHDAKARRGDIDGALAELSRLRTLRGSPSALRDRELAHHLARSDVAKAMAVYEAMLPAERSAETLALLVPKDPEALRARLGEALSARDMPNALLPLSRALGDDPAAAFEAEGAKVFREERARRGDAATWVLLHRERYSLDASGLLHYVVYDLRRVSGTTDVEAGAGAQGPEVHGREARWTRSRRIFKKDGRIVEPDRPPYAAQLHADLSELQPGDFIEQSLEGFALPDATGQLAVLTQDLLPERARVHRASIEVVAPKDLPLVMGAHPLLGAPEVQTFGEQRSTFYRLDDAAPRRLELAVSSQDQDVGLAFGTSRWETLSAHLAELPLLLGDEDPRVSSWAREASRGRTGRALVEALVMAAGKAVRVANGFDVSDWMAAQSRGPQIASARTILELGEGSRTHLVARGLTALGIRSELRLAEGEPGSARDDRPARLGQFHHPLLVVGLDDGDLWLDLDVPGPPLPPGRISPEVRGRMSLASDGSFRKVPAGEEAVDEIDLRLSLDEAGHARGEVAFVLRGRPAQFLADALEEVVGSAREELLRNVALGFLPYASVEAIALGEAARLGEVKVRAEIAIPSYAEPTAEGFTLPGMMPLHVVYPYPYAATLGTSFAKLASRESALSIEMAETYRLSRSVELPRGMKLASSLPEAEVRSPLLEARRRGSFDDRLLREELSLSLATGRIPREDYASFLEAARQIDEAFLEGVRIERAQGDPR